MAFGKSEVSTHLDVIEQHYLSKTNYLCGNNPTFADSWVTIVLSLLELVGFDFHSWVKVKQWMSQVKSNSDYIAVSHSHEDKVRTCCYGVGFSSTGTINQDWYFAIDKPMTIIVMVIFIISVNTVPLEK